MRINEVAQRTGLSRKTIRFYEAKGLLNVERSDNSYRDYREDVVEQLKQIALLRQAGISLSDIQLWQNGVISTQEMLQKRLAELQNVAGIATDQVNLCRELLGALDKTGRLGVDALQTRGQIEQDEQEETESNWIQPCVGLDIGTTTVSAVVLDMARGVSVAAYTVPNDAGLPARHRYEKCQDVGKIADRVEKLMQFLLRRYPNISAIGVAGQMHGIVYLDDAGHAVSPLYTWQDERAAVGEPSPCHILSERSGYAVASGYGLATHFALMQSGEVPPDAVQLCTVMDYIVVRLCALTRPVMHITNAASLGLYRVADHCFDEDAIRRAGIDPAILPRVTPRCEVVGNYHGIPVSVAIGDNQASFLGSVKDPSRTALANFGTGSQISVMVQNGEASPTDAALEIRPFSEDALLYSGSALCGGRAYALLERFFRRFAVVGGLPDAEQYEVLNKMAEDGIEKGTFLNVRTTFCGTRSDPTERGSITDIAEGDLTPEALTAGVLRGMATELYEMYSRMPHGHVNTLVISGNAARKNPALRRITELVFGMKAMVPAHKEEVALGAAIFAAMASGCVRAEDTDRIAACLTYLS